MGRLLTLQARVPQRVRVLDTIRGDVAEIIAMLRSAKRQARGTPVELAELIPIDLRVLMSLLGLRYEEVEELGGVKLGSPWAEQDTTVAGAYNFVTRTITAAAGRPLVERRFTIAHEIAHSLYDTGILRLRERTARKSGSPTQEDKSRERMADLFAAELLMPVEAMTDGMTKRFDSPIDGTIPRDDLAHFLSVATHQKIDSAFLARMPQVRRAGLFAVADNFRGRSFVPLNRQFEVSAETMAIRLVELGLVL